MEKCIIFGTGKNAARNYNNKLKYHYDVIFFVDNNSQKWGDTFCGKKIISPDDLTGYEMVKIIVCSTFYAEIGEQLKQMGLTNIYYISKANILCPFLQQFKSIHNNRTLKRILFVQNWHGIRTYKIACVIKSLGIDVDFAYTDIHPKETGSDLILPYTNIIPIFDLKEFIHYVNQEDYDLVHCSNAPDYLTTLLLNTNKPVIHDNQDMMSLRGDISISEMILEYNANKKSAGNMYVTDEVRDIAIEKFDLFGKKTFVVNNYVLKSQKPSKYLRKLSEQDHEIHCVYAGGVVDAINHHRYYYDIFMKIANAGIHVHFYAPIEAGDACKKIANQSEYLHYEGYCLPQQIFTEMTQYDVGLVELNITNRNRTFLQTTFPNKIFEYIFVGLPVAVCDITSMRNFVDQYHVGQYLDLNGDIYNQLRSISKIAILDHMLEDIEMTMDQQAGRIEKFYSDVIKEYRNHS